MSQQNHTGFEGTVVIGGVDVNTTGWSGTETTSDLENTNTSHYDSGTNRCYYSAIPGVTKFEGSFKFNYDNFNLNASRRPGLYATAALTIASTGQVITLPKILIKSVAFGEANMNAIRECTCEFVAVGIYTITA